MSDLEPDAITVTAGAGVIAVTKTAHLGTAICVKVRTIEPIRTGGNR